MIDGIRLRLPRTAADGLAKRLTDYRRRDINTGSGNVGAMRVCHNLDGIIIYGSLAKYLEGENMTPLNRAGVRSALEKLETETGIDIIKSGGEVVVCSLEVGSTIVLKERPSEYLRLFGDPPVYTKSVYSKAGFIETVSFGTPTGAYQFCAYDKGREMADKRQAIPLLFSGSNILRLEYRIIRRRGIRARFRRDLTARDLFDYDIYRELQKLFYRAYKAIPKTGRVCYIDTSKPMTPARLEQLQAEQWRQTYPEKYNAGLQALRETGALTKKNIERIRAGARRRGQDFSMSEKSPLIAELDVHVYNAAMSGA